MQTQHKAKSTALAALVASLLFAPALFAGTSSSGVFINGVELDQQQIALLYQTTGVIFPPGHYLVQGGCVSHLESGQTQCAPQPGQYGDGAYQYGGDVYGGGSQGYAYGGDAYSYGGGAGDGYGYNNGDGTWFHRGSDYSGGYSVGSDSNGCIYTPNWSNC